jgi:hypothetical protein
MNWYVIPDVNVGKAVSIARVMGFDDGTSFRGMLYLTFPT